MKLAKINYKSAVFFATIALVLYLIIGVYQLFFLKNILLQSGIEEYVTMASTITSGNSLVKMPIIGTIITYLMGTLLIAIYNFVAKKYPISWEVKK